MPAAGLVDRDRLLGVAVGALRRETQLPEVQLKRNRSRSARWSLVLPIVARSEVDPGGHGDRVLLLRRLAIVGVASLALPSGSRPPGR